MDVSIQSDCRVFSLKLEKRADLLGDKEKERNKQKELNMENVFE